MAIDNNADADVSVEGASNVRHAGSVTETRVEAGTYSAAHVYRVR